VKVFKRFFSDFSELVMSKIIESVLPVEETDDSYRPQFIEIVPLTTDGPCTGECDSGDWSAEVKQETLSAVKQEPDDVCCID